jgi:hypothetical protein
MGTLDKSHARLMTFLNMREINSMLDYDMLDIGTLDITASPSIILSAIMPSVVAPFFSCIRAFSGK